MWKYVSKNRISNSICMYNVTCRYKDKCKNFPNRFGQIFVKNFPENICKPVHQKYILHSK